MAQQQRPLGSNSAWRALVFFARERDENRGGRHIGNAPVAKNMTKQHLHNIRWVVARSIGLCSATLVALAFAAPLLEAARSPAAHPIYQLLSFICHQVPSRSPFVAGSNAGLCFRCMAMYTALAAGMALPLGTVIQRLRCGFYSLRHLPLDRLVAVVGGLFILLLIADGLLPMLGWPPSTNPRRVVTGFLGGWTIASLLVRSRET